MAVLVLGSELLSVEWQALDGDLRSYPSLPGILPVSLYFHPEALASMPGYSSPLTL